MIKRSLDKLLAEGHGKQLIILIALSLICVVIAISIAYFVFDDDVLQWQDVVGLFLDPGVFGGFKNAGHDWFRLILALLSVFLFSALLVSVFTNVFENISVSVRDGHRRYKLKNHVMILGGSHRIKGVLEALLEENKTVVILSEKNPNFAGDYIFYQGKRDSKNDLLSARVEFAQTVYIVGEDDEKSHDARNLMALDYLTEICSNADHDIHCYITVCEQSTVEIFQYFKAKVSGRLLLVDIINDYEYEAEQLLVNTDFLPIINSDSESYSQIIIIGTGPAAQAVAYTVAHLSHYPNYTTKGLKTCITFISKDMKEWMDKFVAARPGLFELSEYSYISPSGERQSYIPSGSYGDFLDIKWEFIDTYDTSTLATKYIKETALNSQVITTVFVCHNESRTNIESVLHLPREVFSAYGKNVHNIAVYLRDSQNLITLANETNMYGTLTTFGDNFTTDRLMNRRSKFGKRVNYVYDKAYGNPPSKNEEEAWYKIPEAHKYSSICCANAMFLRQLCYNLQGERLPIYEAEHRRWMMSVLLMGYRYGETTDRKKYIHADIIPFKELPPSEQDKDKILIDALNEILAD